MSGTRRGIVTGGTWCVDRNQLVEHWPGEDGLAEILTIEARGGGSGFNLAADIRRLDPEMPVETIALVGDDDNGRLLMAEADAFGIGRAGMQVAAGGITQFTEAFVSRASGRRTHIFFQGVGAALTPNHFDFGGSTARLLHLGLPGVHRTMDAPWGVDANGWVTVLRKARASGLETNLELVSASPERIAALGRPCLPYLDLLVVNDVEIGAIGGEATVRDGKTDRAACLSAAKRALELGPMRMVAVHFPMGGIAVARDGTVVERPSVRVPAEAVVSANGAGDAFASGMVYGFHEGWSLDASLTLAHAAAAASLRSLSTAEGVVSWRACLDLAERWGWREALPA